MAGDLHAVAGEFAPELAAAGGDLPGVQPGLPELRGPVGRECTVRGAGDGILGHAALRGKKARHEIAAAIAGGGDDEAAQAGGGDLRQVRPQVAHGVGGGEHGEAIELGTAEPERDAAERSVDGARDGDVGFRDGRSGGKIQFE